MTKESIKNIAIELLFARVDNGEATRYEKEVYRKIESIFSGKATPQDRIIPSRDELAEYYRKILSI